MEAYVLDTKILGIGAGFSHRSKAAKWRWKKEVE